MPHSSRRSGFCSSLRREGWVAGMFASRGSSLPLAVGNSEHELLRESADRTVILLPEVRKQDKVPGISVSAHRQTLSVGRICQAPNPIRFIETRNALRSFSVNGLPPQPSTLLPHPIADNP